MLWPERASGRARLYHIRASNPAANGIKQEAERDRDRGAGEEEEEEELYWM